ncbi:nucleotidyl transferase AbiEii/AbiGii toxin family protein [Anatilimnocola floriformis]|uniref:nucleotidyl transferase AbiEii/AbiGii toxin family protein n=1 Tax=Anatilimnocola floriformis TaxID=2948575 RepID=UPI0020C32621|nr:nucleotidyl transferase AbiEii/AbiGii toxin family protein [Anatilimnocola floriformis]
MNSNFRDMLFMLADENADFMIVGAYALAFHGIPRATGDFDLFLRGTPENAERVWRALVKFKAPLNQITKQDLSYPRWGLTFGIEPSRIDLMTDISGVDFDAAWNNRIFTMIEERLFPVMGLVDLLANKRAAGRPKDVYDVMLLENKIKEANRKAD